MVGALAAETVHVTVALVIPPCALAKAANTAMTTSAVSNLRKFICFSLKFEKIELGEVLFAT
jgi:hypothetical protein